VSAMDLDHDSRLGAIAEPLHVEAFIAELAVVAFFVTVMPRFAGVDKAVSILASASHSRIALLTNSGPLSVSTASMANGNTAWIRRKNCAAAALAWLRVAQAQAK